MTQSLSSGSTLDDSPDSPAIWRGRLGRELRRLREGKGLVLEDVAGELDLAASSLSRLERGQAPVKAGYLTIMFSLYGVSSLAQRQRLLDMARRGRGKGWWSPYNELLPIEARQYLGLEAAASRLQAFCLLTVPGLLQTEEYAAAVLTASRPELPVSQLQDLVWITRRRQEVVQRSGCRLDLLIDESALLRTVGSAQITARQLDHLVAVAAQPQVTVRAVSLRAAHPVLTYPYTILTFTHPDDQAVVCHHGHGSQLTLSTSQAQAQAAQRLHAALGREAAPLDRARPATARALRPDGQDSAYGTARHDSDTPDC